ncbi:MAG TPA: hypothetical protein DCL49_01755, partial [Candidatus Omnitrophica bacterium]|nr:hypothetical protein [Candidatus Omnitrophota bacterium]
EEDQASYLVKRAVYLAAYGVKQAQFGTYIEHFPYKEDKGGIHNWFTLMGLVYNGIPESGKCEGQLPCPDPGKDVKKLSYYAYKFLIEKLKGSDWDNVKPIETNTPSVYLYEFSKPQGLLYVAWRDWWDVNDTDEDIAGKKITLDFAKAEKIKITEAVPDYATGKEAGIAGYENAFYSYSKDVIGGKVEFTLDKKPVYIEGISKLTE